MSIIKNKFSLGEEVYLIHRNKVVSREVLSIYYTKKLESIMVNYTVCGVLGSVEECSVFKTKEKL